MTAMAVVPDVQPVREDEAVFPVAEKAALLQSLARHINNEDPFPSDVLAFLLRLLTHPSVPDAKVAAAFDDYREQLRLADDLRDGTGAQWYDVDANLTGHDRHAAATELMAERVAAELKYLIHGR